MKQIIRSLVTALVLVMSVSGLAIADDGIIKMKSQYTVPVTANKLVTVLKEKGMTVMGRVNHSANAKTAGLELKPTELVIFGNPKVGTPLMHCARSVAIDLPQKALIWEDASGQVWLGYNDPAYLKQRHSIAGCDAVLEKIQGALNAFAKAATE